ncbi:MAG: preprotein translocase subunit SecE [Anaerolineales bacterium]|nr:preprotein translocase subunit SecE [Anaerolineales bacterium]MCB9004371.1 preprotein translocase subunit SecE [Ardenticatenaceae bacterium]
MADTEKATKTAVSKKSAAKNKTANQVNPISRYLRETRGELRKVTWPTREESWRLTAIVLGVSLAFSIFLWVFDSLFSNAIKFLLQQAII